MLKPKTHGLNHLRKSRKMTTEERRRQEERRWQQTRSPEDNWPDYGRGAGKGITKLIQCSILLALSTSTVESSCGNNNKTSYRSILLLPVISNIFGKLILKCLKLAVEEKNLIPDYQFEFRYKPSIFTDPPSTQNYRHLWERAEEK